MKRLVFLPFFLLLTAPALAQVDSTATVGQRAPADTSDSVLPDIAPREIEIRGQLEIAFPSLERQPLVGFNPPPRVRTIPPDQQPFVEEYKQESADLPPSPLQRPEAPPIATLTTGEPMGGLVEASGGRYYTRDVQAHLALPATGRTAFHAELDYRGSDGFLPEGDFVVNPDVRAPYDALEAALGITTTQRRFRAGGSLDGFTTVYTLYGAVPGAPGAAPQPNRRGGGIGAATWIEVASETITDFSLRLRYGGAGYETDVFNQNDDDFRRIERRLDASAGLGFPAAGGEIVADASFAGAGLDASGLEAAQVFSGGGGYRFVARRAISLTLGARYLAFASDQRRSARGSVENVSGGYIAPDVRLELYPAPTLRLYAKSEPGVTFNGLADLYRQNPYLVDEPLVLPTVRQLDAEGGAELFAGPVQLSAHAGYEYYPSFLFFEHETRAVGLPYRRGLHTANYAVATVVHGGASLSAALPGGLSAMLSVSVRDGRLEDDGAIPYFAPVAGEAMLSYAFARRRGLIQLVGHYESKRYVSLDRTRKVGDFIGLDLSASYDVSANIGLVAGIDNLAFDALERWAGYPQPPLVARVGFRVMW